MIQCVSWGKFTHGLGVLVGIMPDLFLKKGAKLFWHFYRNLWRDKRKTETLLNVFPSLHVSCSIKPKFLLLAGWKRCWKLMLRLKYSCTNTRDTISHFCQELRLSAAKYFALVMKNEQLMYRWEFPIANTGAVKNMSKILCACIDRDTWLCWVRQRMAALQTDYFCLGSNFPQICPVFLDNLWFIVKRPLMPSQIQVCCCTELLLSLAELPRIRQC